MPGRYTHTQFAGFQRGGPQAFQGRLGQTLPHGDDRDVEASGADLLNEGRGRCLGQREGHPRMVFRQTGQGSWEQGGVRGREASHPYPQLLVGGRFVDALFEVFESGEGFGGEPCDHGAGAGEGHTARVTDEERSAHGGLRRGHLA